MKTLKKCLLSLSLCLLLSLVPFLSLSAAELSVVPDTDIAPALVAYGYPFTLPDVRVTGASADAKVTFTVYHGDATKWTPLDGCTDLTINDANRTLRIDRHGFYRIVYKVTDGAKKAETEYFLNVQDTLTGVRVQTNGTVPEYHPGEKITLSGAAVYGTFSYTGERLLSGTEWSVSPDKAPDKTGDLTVTVTARCDYTGTTVTKTASLTVKVVPAGQTIDRTQVTLSVKGGGTEKNVSYRLPCTLPDVTASAKHEDGKTTDLHDSVTFTIQHHTGTEWTDVAGLTDLPIGTVLAGADKPLTFIPTEHGYYRVVYRAVYEGKEDSAVFNLNIMDTLVGVEVDTSRVRTALDIGEKPDLSGLLVSRVLSYTGASALKEGEYRVDLGGFDPAKEGSYPVTVSVTSEYGGTKTASFLLTVADPLLSFTVTSLPARSVFAFGEAPDLTGIAGKAVFKAGGEREADPGEITVTGFSPKKAGVQTVTFLYRGIPGGTAEFTVSDTTAALIADASGAKKEYREGEKPDLTGVTVTRLCASGKTEVLGADDYTVSPADFRGCEEGTYLIRVTVKDPVTGEERSASYPVTVSASGGSAVLPLAVAAAAVLAAGGTVVLLLLKKKKAGSAS